MIARVANLRCLDDVETTVPYQIPFTLYAIIAQHHSPGCTGHQYSDVLS